MQRRLVQRRKVGILLAIPAFILAVLLVVAELANQLIVNVLVSGVRHPLWGVYELILTLLAVGALPFAAYLWVRHLPRHAGDRFFDPFYRWIYEGAEEEAARKAAAVSASAGRHGPLARRLVFAVGIGALAAAIGLTSLANPAARPPAHLVAVAIVRRCPPALCGGVPGATLVVTSLTDGYVAPARSGRRAPSGERYVRMTVWFHSRRATGAANLRDLRLSDGTALSPPTALPHVAACHEPDRRRPGSATAALCFLAHGATGSPITLVWPSLHLRVALPSGG